MFFIFIEFQTIATGLYVLFGGLSAMLVSKEYYVLNGDSWYVLAFICTISILNAKIGPALRDYFETVRVVSVFFYNNLRAVKDTDIFT